MSKKNTERNEFEINIRRLFQVVFRKSWLVIVVALLGAVVTFLGTFYFVTPLYQSSAMFYVNNSMSVGETSLSISTGDLIASKDLVSSYIVILKTRGTLNEVIDYADVDLTYSELKNMISASAVNNTEIFQVTVTSPDPQEAELLANAIAHLLPTRIGAIGEGSSAKIVDYAVVASAPSSPNYIQNTLLGFVLGFGISVAVIILFELFDITIRSEEDIALCTSKPILAAVPDMNANLKNGYYYNNSTQKEKRKNVLTGNKEANMVGGGISFAAAEAYKLLRTKLQFSFADENDCHVIGVSSSLAGEGKTTSAINIAYTLSLLNYRVLLIECDLRRPTLSIKAPVEKVPGLSNYLARQMALEEIVQNCALDNTCSFHAITSGRVPPNPIELLSSNRMFKALEKLRQSYDYIIMDLPPVGEVSDSLVASKLVDGMLVVVRQNYCDRIILENTIRQFEFLNTRILGIVTTCAGGVGTRGGRKYYRRYYSKYQGSYAARVRSNTWTAPEDRQ